MMSVCQFAAHAAAGARYSNIIHFYIAENGVDIENWLAGGDSFWIFATSLHKAVVGGTAGPAMAVPLFSHACNNIVL